MASYQDPAKQKSSPAKWKTESREPRFEQWRRDDLYYLAKQLGIEGRAKMSNEELVQALKSQA